MLTRFSFFLSFLFIYIHSHSLIIQSDAVVLLIEFVVFNSMADIYFVADVAAAANTYFVVVVVFVNMPIFVAKELKLNTHVFTKSCMRLRFCCYLVASKSLTTTILFFRSTRNNSYERFRRRRRRRLVFIHQFAKWKLNK